MPEQFGDKTHEATPHRRQQAREQGNVAKSLDLSSVIILLGAVLALKFLGAPLVEYMGRFAQHHLSEPILSIQGPEFAIVKWKSLTTALTDVLLPILGVIVLSAVAANLAQVGFLMVPQKLVPDWNRVNPLQGIQRIFSFANVIRLALGVFKIVVVALVGYLSILTEYGTVLKLSDMESVQIALFIVQLVIKTCLWVALALLVLALIDFGYQRWKHEQDLRMTTQEVRDEMKTLQGDPQVMNRRRHLQRQLVVNRLQSAIPQADVVVTNPTHLAVAIKYDPSSMSAPVVVAKGAGTLAQRIRDLAQKHDIPVVERKPLALALYKKVEVHQPIPAEEYAAVAEVLRFVYQLQGRSLPGSAQAA